LHILFFDISKYCFQNFLSSVWRGYEQVVSFFGDKFGCCDAGMEDGFGFGFCGGIRKNY